MKAVLQVPGKLRSLDVEQLLAPAAREGGYRNRGQPKSDSVGLWFVFPGPGVFSFTMQGVPFPLEVLWFDSAGMFVGSAQMPANAPHLFAPSSPIQHAIEVASGWTLRNGVPARLWLP